MSDPEPLTQHLQRMVTHPGEEIGRFSSFLRMQAKLWRAGARRLNENNLLAMSAALSFQTIFALIPTLVLAFLAARALGVLEDNKASLRRFLAASGFSQIILEDDRKISPPADGQPAPERKVINIADEIEHLVEQVEEKLTVNRVGPIGAALFIWTALTLLNTIESSLNRIFRAPRSRSMARRVLLYWSVMTLGPVALAIASFLGSQVLRAFQGWPVLSWLFAGVGWAMPILVGILTLAAVYILVPNTRVGRRAALGGAFVAVMLWLVAKGAFSLYVQHLVVGGNLYGIIGVLPLFMLWLSLSWMIFLFGAELANTAANRRLIWASAEMEPAFILPSDALAVTLAVTRTFETGRGPARLDQIASQVRLPEDAVKTILGRLTGRDLVCEVNGERQQGYVLARAPASIRVSDILQAGVRRALPGPVAGRSDDPAALAAEVDSRMRSTIADLTVADLLAKNGPGLTGDSGEVVRDQQSQNRERVSR